MHLIGIHLTDVSRAHASHRDASRRREYNCCWVRRISIFEIWEKTLFCHYTPPYPCLAAAEVRIVVGLPRRCISPPDRKLELQLHRHFESRSTSLDSSSSYLLDLHR